MNILYATCNIHNNSINICTYAGYFLRINCGKAEEGLKTIPCSECALNALVIDEPLEYARLYLEGNIQMCFDVEEVLLKCIVHRTVIIPE